MGDENLYAKGIKVWVPHLTEVWMSATLIEDFVGETGIMKLFTDNSQEEVHLKIKSTKDLPHIRNPTILIGQNDLTSLSYLHEPGVLNNLRVRFCERQIIYTYCGIILVAINPYAELPLYGASIIRAYRGRSMGELEPHIFALSEEAYARLERENTNLSIIVSGESGAGKTVSAKYAMRYFAAVGGSESETQVERKVIASSPIMEAFGNAKTTRNDNSSRFGKFTKLLFKNNMGTMILMGASMQTYLLEKSRVVFQAAGERNYHIFYQLCAARDQYPELLLEHQSHFSYLNQGDSPHIDRISDKAEFKQTIHAMTVLGFSKDQVTNILRMLAGILHLGNVDFIPKHKVNSMEVDTDACDIKPSDVNLSIASEIFKVNGDDLRKWLLQRQIKSVYEQVLIPNNVTTAQSAKDGLVKHIYAKLFLYIISLINKCLNMSYNKKQSNFIGVLDIYGFETFELNSFEQFCINYANEKLQQQFNQHVFKLEQEEYLKEGITWTMIDYYDNQPCIDLIESKLGVLDLLDEECRMPQGTDESWVGKLIDKCDNYHHFEKSRFGSTSFIIKHFSDKVKYDVHGFLDKNRDTVSEDLLNVIKLSDLPLCRELIDLEEVDTLVTDADQHIRRPRVVISASKPQVTSHKQQRRTIGLQFRESLSSLIATLHATTPHYVRCIKPNEEKVPFKWEASKIVQQLRACGVLETVRISAAGFPSRWSYHEFYMRYQLLNKRLQGVTNNKEDVKKGCQNIVTRWISDKDKYRFGNTQIFFRAGQVAYLEQIRSNLRKRYIVIVQSMIRRFIMRKRYLRLKSTALGLQRHARGYLARQKAQRMREDRAALIIMKYARGWLCRRRYKLLCRSVNGIQQYARGMLARKRFREALDQYRAIQIQRFVRGYLARRAYHKKKRSIVVCQSAARRYLARRLFKRVKAEAKTITHIQNMYKGLENKIMQMQCKIDDLNRENTNLKHKTSEISVLKMKLEVKRNLEMELKSIKALVAEKDNVLLALQQQLELERSEKIKLIEAKDTHKQEYQRQMQQWRIENEKLNQQLNELMEQTKNTESNASLQRNLLLAEVDSNEINEAYQRVLKDKEIIEHENMQLKEELSKFSKLNEIRGTAISQNDTDIGYASQHSTLNRSEITNNNNDNYETNDMTTGITCLVIKLRNILEEEQRKNKYLAEQLEKLRNRSSTTEDFVRVSELEVENDKLRSDYELLRSSIQHGTEVQELEAQHYALQEELQRRRDECIQLKAVLQQQSQSLTSFGSSIPFNISMAGTKYRDDYELMEAFQAQKLINRQLETELRALTEENNAHLEILTQQIEELRNEKIQLQNILLETFNDDDHDKERDIETLRKSERYLRYELQKALIDYTQVQEKLNKLAPKFEELNRNNEKLESKLQEHGINMGSRENNNNNSVKIAKQKIQNYQGLMKFQSSDLDKILQRLVSGMSARMAFGLLPGLPAHIIFMCIRYTDLINADNDVRELLSKFVLQIRKIYRSPHITEIRSLWLVNSITLLNLLKQYGDVEEYIKFNTEKQKQQQLKNFNLSEYRRVVLELIVNLYQALVQQIEESMEPYIVPAILNNDEIQRHPKTHDNRRRLESSASIDQQHAQIPAWKQLLQQLEFFFKQLTDYGLDMCYTQQIFYQLLYFICAVAMNCLMLRGDICMWETGMVIRYNLGCIEGWVRSKNMSDDVLLPLAPLNQVSQLLQSRKSEQDVQSICDLCPLLNTAQVLKIMKSYTLDDYESEITPKFLEKLVSKLNNRPEHKNIEFTMDQKLIHPFKVVFKYSEIKLEEIELPKHLNLDDLLTKI